MMDTAVSVERRYAPGHLAALRRFAVGITVFTVLGHAWFGFEQSYAQPLVALATAYAMQLLLEALDAWCSGRRPRFTGGFGKLVDFFLSAHISALAVAMLLYYNDRLWIVAFTTAVAIGSKWIIRVPVGPGSRHVFNPSNLGIAVTLLLFPSVGLMMPWMFSSQLGPVGDWAIPAILLCIGVFLNGRYNKRLPLIVGFGAGFVAQAVARALLLDHSLLAMLAALTGPAAIIYLFFMLPDPATTPQRLWPQAAFGFAVAMVYLILIAAHIVFGLFFALTIVCAARGMWLCVLSVKQRRAIQPVGQLPPAAVAVQSPA
jgi:enediyne biosynthesis protein E5